jgi:hypothetical protein
MKTKIIISVLALLVLGNICFSMFLLKENRELSSDISTINEQLYRLDLDALEKIKTQPKDFDVSEDCGSGTFQIPCE